MRSAAFVFPGQGSQHAGMGADVAARDSRYSRLVADADRLSGIDVARGLCVLPEEGAAATVPSTVATQLAVFALSVSLGRILLEGGIRPRVVAGHSLGEFSALVVGGWLDVDAGLELVVERASAMERCCAEHDGTMIAVVGLGEASLADAVAGTGAVVANVNSPTQIVVSGTRAALAQVDERALARGASMVIELPVAGAFHSLQMRAAGERLAESVERLTLRRGEIALISSVTGRPVDDLPAYRRDLVRQITAPVRWLDVMTEIASLDVDVVEVGPGAVLRGLFRQLDRRRPVATCGSLEACDALLAERPPHSNPRRPLILSHASPPRERAHPS